MQFGLAFFIVFEPNLAPTWPQLEAKLGPKIAWKSILRGTKICLKIQAAKMTPKSSQNDQKTVPKRSKFIDAVSIRAWIAKFASRLHGSSIFEPPRVSETLQKQSQSASEITPGTGFATKMLFGAQKWSKIASKWTPGQSQVEPKMAPEAFFGLRKRPNPQENAKLVSVSSQSELKANK